MSTTLSVVVIEGEDSDDEVRDLFIRLQAGTALTRQQARDAWPGNMGPYIERLAGKAQRQPMFAIFSSVDQRGQSEVDDGSDPFQNYRQTCAQMLVLFLHRIRSSTVPSVRTQAIDELYHEDTAFDAAGIDARNFEDLLHRCDEILSLRLGQKIRKNRAFSLLMLLQDLGRENILVAREIPTIARWFWYDVVDVRDEREPAGRVTSASTIRDHYGWLQTRAAESLALPTLDPSRFFEGEQQVAIWERADGIQNS